jgi:hypothetical protein
MVKNKKMKSRIWEKIVEFVLPAVVGIVAVLIQQSRATTNQLLQEIKVELKEQNLQIYENSLDINTLEIKVDEIKEDLEKI